MAPADQGSSAGGGRKGDAPGARTDAPHGDDRVVIKKYANRRLYNTASSSYVTLDHLADMVREGVDFVVYDAKTGEDITRSVLTQIIFEQENKGQNLLPITFLRQVIRFYGDSMQMLLPRYLEVSIDSFTKEQEKYREQMSKSFGVGGFGLLEDQVRRIFADCSPFRLPAELYDTDNGGWKETTLRYRVKK